MNNTIKNSIFTISFILLGILFVWLGDLCANYGVYSGIREVAGFSLYPGTAIAFYVAGGIIGIGVSLAAMVKFLIKYKAD